MKRKLISTLVAVSMLSTLPCVSAAELDMQPETEEFQDFEEISLETLAEDEMPHEILPAEISEPDPTKSDRFIIKYKNDRNESISEASKIASYSVQSVSEVADSATLSKANAVMDESILTMQSVQLTEKVDIDDFVNHVMTEESDNIEYVQPDYTIDLSALEEKDGNNTGNNVTETDNSVNIAEAEQTYSPEKDSVKTMTEAASAVVLEDAETENLSDEEQETIVALIDTGVDINHTALADHIYINESDNNNDDDGNGYLGDINGWDFFNNTPNVYNSDFGLEQAHGTHIAGIIAGTAPNAKILPLKVFEHGTAYTSDIIEAIHYAESMGAKIVNCSWGCTDENMALKEAVEQSQMTFVCAVGNNRLNLNETPIYPASYDLDNVVSVTSVNADGGLSYFSNYGNVDIAALGRDVEGIFPENETGVLSGTSISAGYVSGALASVYTTGEETANRMFSSADKLLNLQETVTDGRRLNLENLLNNVSITEVTDINPTEDFNTEGYTRTPEASWELFSELDNVSVKTGNEYIAVLKEDGSVWTWGMNCYGQLGLGNYTNTTVPKQVPSISGVVEIAAGPDHMLVRKSDGTVYGWGRNYNGALGTSASGTSTVPVKMLNVNDAKRICAGANVSYIIKGDYELYSSGANEYGQMGDGTTVPKSVLTKVNISEKVVSVDAIMAGAAAVTENGCVYTWGYNNYGRLGDGTTENRTTPQLILDDHIVDVSVGFFNMMALTNDGRVYEWSVDDYKKPVIMSGYSGCNKVVVGRQAQFIKQGNKIKVIGNNAYGSLGVGDTVWHNSWTDITGEFVDFDISEYWGAAIGTNGCIYTWGVRNIDTKEYVTAPEKLSDKINDFAADEIENATTTSLGETKGNLISTTDKDYYKFRPASTGSYSIYSISDIDLVCKIYTKSSDGTYKQEFSNDDAMGMVSPNNRDFYLSKTLTANTDYYIYIYPYGSNDYTNKTYTMYIKKESNGISTSYTLKAGKYNDIYLTVRNITSLSDRTFTITYDASKMQLIDASLLSFKKETAPGSIPGTGITVVSNSPGKITFKFTKNTVSGKKFTGTLNIIRFKALVNGSASAQCTIV